MTIERREVGRELHFSFNKALFASGCNEVEAFLKHIISRKNEKEPEEREVVWGRMSSCWRSLINNYKTWLWKAMIVNCKASLSKQWEEKVAGSMTS